MLRCGALDRFRRAFVAFFVRVYDVYVVLTILGVCFSGVVVAYVGSSFSNTIGGEGAVVSAGLGRDVRRFLDVASYGVFAIPSNGRGGLDYKVLFGGPFARRYRPLFGCVGATG